MGRKYVWHEIVELCVLVVWCGFVFTILSWAFGFGALGFTESEFLNKYVMYIAPGAVFLLMITGLKVWEIVEKARGSPFPERAIIHDPTEPPSLIRYIKPLTTWWRMSLFFACIWIVICLGGVMSNTFVTNAYIVGQQFTPAASFFFAVEPASTVETLGAFAVMFVMLTLVSVIGKKIKGNPKAVIAFSIIVLLVFALSSTAYGLTNHKLRYGFNDKKMMAVANFWATTGVVTAISGSVIPGLEQHEINNAYDYLINYLKVSKTLVFIVSLFILIGLIVFLVVTWPKGNNFKVENEY